MSWIIGRPHLITWSSVDMYYIDGTNVPQPDTIKIEVSHDDGATWEPVVASTPNTGSFLWAAVTGPAVPVAKIRFSGVNNTDIEFVSSVFDIEEDVLTSIVITPSAAGVSKNASLQFSAVGKNQDGQPVLIPPVFVWAVAGGGVVDPNGVFTAGDEYGGPHDLTASVGPVVGRAAVTVESTSGCRFLDLSLVCTL